MKKPLKVWDDVYMVGGAELSHPHDCSVYLLDAGDLVLIDCGAGRGFDRLVDNIAALGLEPKRLSAVLVTHAHIDHIGSLRQLQDVFGLQVIAHEMDADAIERGVGVGAEFYRVDYFPCPVDLRIRGDEETLRFGEKELRVVHIPGHTPGSIAAYVDTGGKRVLFGQDIHGPYYPEWGAEPARARVSLQRLIDLRADILCEGHFGIYQPADAVEAYIAHYLHSL